MWIKKAVQKGRRIRNRESGITNQESQKLNIFYLGFELPSEGED